MPSSRVTPNMGPMASPTVENGATTTATTTTTTTDGPDSPKACLVVEGNTYLVLNTMSSGLLSAGINGGLAVAMYPRSALDKSDAGVWAWPNTLAGDLVVTSIVMAVLTWVIAGGLTLNDDFRQAPLKIASYPGGPPPRWVSIWPRMRPLFFNDPSREYLNFPNKFYGFLNNLKAGFYLGLLMALVVALPVSLFLMIKTSQWSTIDLVYLKTVYGFAVEVPIAYLTVRTALEQCHDHATHTAMARAKRESRDRMDGRRSRSPQMTSV